MNLGWKLAAVIQGRASAGLLDTYERERLPFARTLVATTDRAFQPMVKAGLEGALTRRLVAPTLLTLLTRFEATRRALFRMVSQVHIHYDHSPLSSGTAGRVRGGDRLPWTGGVAGADNFAPLASLDWQAHVYGEAAPKLATACAGLGLPMHVFPADRAARVAGLAANALYLVRPDGYVALAAIGPDAAKALVAYARRHGLQFTRA